MGTDVLPVLQSKDERRKFYNKIARVYDLLAEKSEQPVRVRALEMLAAQAGESVLEIGFGTGHAWSRSPTPSVRKAVTRRNRTCTTQEQKTQAKSELFHVLTFCRALRIGSSCCTFARPVDAIPCPPSD
jgi:hypothetical protein